MIEAEPLEDRPVPTAFVERAALVPTSLGPAGVVISLPPEPAGLGVLIVQGLDSNRSGANAKWTTTARTLAAAGIAALRVDFPGIGDSAGIPGGKASHRPMLAEVAAWFRAETEVERLAAIGACYGAKPALSLAARGDLDGPVALITPALVRPSSTTFLGRLRRRARRRIGRPHPIDRAVVADLETVARRGDVLVLLGEHDRQAAVTLASARRRLDRSAGIREVIVPGERLYPVSSAFGQSEMIARLSAWAVAIAEPPARAATRGGG